MSPEQKFMEEVLAELTKARRKFPGDNCTYVALGEEVGELAKAMLDETPSRVREEAVQVAVMAARCALDGDSSVSAYRAKQGLEPIP